MLYAIASTGRLGQLMPHLWGSCVNIHTSITMKGAFCNVKIGTAYQKMQICRMSESVGVGITDSVGSPNGYNGRGRGRAHTHTHTHTPPRMVISGYEDFVCISLHSCVHAWKHAMRSNANLNKLNTGIWEECLSL